ncbi:MAG: hypothetical protein ACTSWG_10405 [Candidatus Helarchaeota archaeon]
MNTDSQIRKLARSAYWQNIYEASKKCSGVYLFKNRYNFSGIQSRFLHWLSVYSMLYEEIGKHESKFLSESVINDDIRCDAYLYYRSIQIDSDWKNYQKQQHQSKIDSKRKKKFSEGERTNIDVDLRSK